VRLKLQEIIDHEDKQNPLSDDELVKELAKHGLTVARRTVTKYRKAMSIPSSRQRRDWTIVGDQRPKEEQDEDAEISAAPAEPQVAGGNGHHVAVSPLATEGTGPAEIQREHVQSEQAPSTGYRTE
jgi:hypothetical protein